GFRPAFPTPPNVTPGRSVPLAATATGTEKRWASSVPGARPALPHAARSRRLDSHPIRGKNGSSEMTHEPDSLGYTMLLKFVPKAEFLSARRAPVTNRRSRTPTCSSTYPPSVTWGDTESPTVAKTTPPTPAVPVTILRPDART